MKRSAVSIIVLASLVLVLLLVTAFTAVSSANAQLGNTGVPARCGSGYSPTGTGDMYCNAADGTNFYNVPSNHYLLVTDVVIIPWDGPTAGLWRGWLTSKMGTSNLLTTYFEAVTADSRGDHYTVPVMWLPSGAHLEGTLRDGSSGYAYLYVYGLLTTNYTYVPLMSR